MTINKRKQKPWYRLRNIFLVIVFAIVTFFGWAFIEVWQVYTAEPNPTIDYRAKLRQMAEQQAGVTSQQADESWAICQININQKQDFLHKS